AVNLADPGDSDFVAIVATAVAESGLPWTRLVLELVETTLIGLPSVTRRAMAELVERGVRFAVDDFGTGYSSLARLKELPAQIVKLDRQFVCGVGVVGWASDLGRGQPFRSRRIPVRGGGRQRGGRQRAAVGPPGGGGAGDHTDRPAQRDPAGDDRVGRTRGAVRRGRLRHRLFLAGPAQGATCADRQNGPPIHLWNRRRPVRHRGGPRGGRDGPRHGSRLRRRGCRDRGSIRGVAGSRGGRLPGLAVLPRPARPRVPRSAQPRPPAALNLLTLYPVYPDMETYRGYWALI
ncbi:MAG: EAL domain-containing protein, partial [Pseudonocardiales bacterium]|nr:EAL domain-containing protein [Pseudonocardiales bacterium]